MGGIANCHYPPGIDVVYVYCSNCCVRTENRPNREYAIVAWNTRVGEDHLKIATDALERIKKSSCCNVCECGACIAKEALGKINYEHAK